MDEAGRRAAGLPDPDEVGRKVSSEDVFVFVSSWEGLDEGCGLGLTGAFEPALVLRVLLAGCFGDELGVDLAARVELDISRIRLVSIREA